MNLSSLNYVDIFLILTSFPQAILVFLLRVANFSVATYAVQLMRYGKHSSGNRSISNIFQVPKSWFRHTYAFAFTLSCWTLYNAYAVYLFGKPVPEYLIRFLDLCCGDNREVKATSIVSVVLVTLVFLQCLRRAYETQMVAVFSKTAKMNFFTIYLLSFLFYFGFIISTLSKAPGFVRGTTAERFAWNQLSWRVTLFSLLFLFSWYQQHQSNLILANLRRNKSGKVVTEKHLVPAGGYFKYISSPHMTFEIVSYLSLFMIAFENISWFYLFLMTLVNQIEAAYVTHKWYQKTFPNYPKERKFLIPFIC